MRILLVLAASAAGLYLLLLGTLALFQRRLIYPGAFRSGHQARLPVPPGTEAISIVTADGERLHALWRAPRPGGGIVVTFHGNASRPEPHAERFASAPWIGAGWGVLAIAYRGYPGSTGSPSEEGLIADGLAAADEAARRAPGAPILLHGHSLGTAVAVAVAERRAHLGVYLEAPFDSLAAVVRLAFPYLPTFLLRDTWRTDRRIAGAGGPVLIVHGTEDPIVPVKLGRRLAVAADARFEAVAGDHVSILGLRDREAERFFGARVQAARPMPAGAAP